MVSNGRFQRARKSFGSRRFNRRSGYSSRLAILRRLPYRKKSSIEKKYFDKTYQSSVLEV